MSVLHTLALVDRNGGVNTLNVPPKQYLSPRLSPDGQTLVVQSVEDSENVIWVYDLTGDTAIQQLTFEGDNHRPVWTPDSQRITFSSDRDGTMSLYWMPADGSGVAERLTTAEEGTSHWMGSWSPDGELLVFNVQRERRTDWDIWTLSVEDRETQSLYDAPGTAYFGAELSPNGEWLAYAAGLSPSAADIYVEPFPPTGSRRRISQDGGLWPLWSPEGSELFYRPANTSGVRRLRSVDIVTQPAFAFSNEQALPVQGFNVVSFYRDYDMSPDGELLLMVFPTDRPDSGEPARPQINIILNWFEETEGTGACAMIGQTLSHYKIIEKLGQGGMGEVYRAEDTNLSREVAIKVLPEQFTQDPQRLARFEREAKLLASLNHPNIAAIYGLEEADGMRFLSLELVPGETLQERVAKGPLPVEEALEICRQMADGVEAAHEKGVIHRDLKPANVKVTPEGKVKILDFGLAKAFEAEPPVTDISQSPTLTEEMTRAGVILGTAAYMSPEQAKGKQVDKRADIFAFGAVLFELLTGKKAFEGETITETIAKVLESEPKWELLPENTPWTIRTLLRRCLTKDPHDRLDGIANVRIEIKMALSEPTTVSPRMVSAAQPATTLVGDGSGSGCGSSCCRSWCLALHTAILT